MFKEKVGKSGSSINVGENGGSSKAGGSKVGGNGTSSMAGGKKRVVSQGSLCIISKNQVFYKG